MTTFFTVLVTTLGCLGGTADSRVLEASFSIVLMLLSAKSLLPMEKNELGMESGEEEKKWRWKEWIYQQWREFLFLRALTFCGV